MSRQLGASCNDYLKIISSQSSWMQKMLVQVHKDASAARTASMHMPMHALMILMLMVQGSTSCFH